MKRFVAEMAKMIEHGDAVAVMCVDSTVRVSVVGVAKRDLDLGQLVLLDSTTVETMFVEALRACGREASGQSAELVV